MSLKYWWFSGMTMQEAINLRAEAMKDDRRSAYPPCNRCGAKTLKKAEKLCRVSGGDDDNCHGCEIEEWHEWRTPLERLRGMFLARWDYWFLLLRLPLMKRRWKKEALEEQEAG